MKYISFPLNIEEERILKREYWENIIVKCHISVSAFSFKFVIRFLILKYDKVYIE